MKKKQILIVFLTALALGSSACGYRIRSSVGALPDGIISIGVPAFENTTNEFKVEQILTDAVIRELNRRTRARVVSANSGVDAVLQGEIRSVNSSAVTFGSRSFGSAYLVRVDVGVKLVRLRDSSVVWQNKKFIFRERYTLNSDIRDFFDEKNPALKRLAESFAASLVGEILESASIDSSKP